MAAEVPEKTALLLARIPRRIAAGLLLLSSLLNCGPDVTTRPDGQEEVILDDDDYDNPPSLPPDAYGTPRPTPSPTPLVFTVAGTAVWEGSYPLNETQGLVVETFDQENLGSDGYPVSGARSYLTVRIPGPLEWPVQFQLPLPADQGFRIRVWLDVTFDKMMNDGDRIGFSPLLIPTSTTLLQVEIPLLAYPGY